jgi:glyoxylase-like metal-dependent hydrolase (beta-lactamase superfamily II)
MRPVVYALGALLTSALFLIGLRGVRADVGARSQAETAVRPPELEYFKAINQAGPPKDPQLLFLLMAQYSNLNLQAEGAEFFAARFKEFQPRLTDPQKSLYLSATAVLRAQHASSVPLLGRIGYVNDTVAMLDRAEQLSGGQIFVVNWTAGVVRAELPGLFGQSKAAEAELTWCLDNAAKAPDPGWLREVHYHRGKLALARGDRATAEDHLEKSGYKGWNRPITLNTPFSEDAATGYKFASRRISEVVPGRVYALSGFEFTEYYFVVSDDGRELFGIDAGTRPDSAKGAYESLRAQVPGLPPLTAIFITHSHWDHVGGHSYFRGLNPRPRFYARNNYQEEIAREVSVAPGVFDKYFFGERFHIEDVRSFKPDVTVAARTELKVGGMRIELIPIQGGETSDGMFISLPDQGVMFVGDFIMPYLGAPFVAEGNFQGLLDAIDIVVAEHPRYLLHGHEPLTRNFNSTAILAQLKPDLVWLRAQVLSAIGRGEERGVIHKANLIPPGLIVGQPDVYLPYFIMREHIIDRLYNQNVGYWQPDMQGIDHLTSADRGSLFVDYLRVTEGQLVKGVERMVTDAKYELASSLLETAGKRFPDSPSVGNARRLVYLKLMEKYENTDPFKFIIYSSRIGEQVPPMASGK